VVREGGNGARVRRNRYAPAVPRTLPEALAESRAVLAHPAPDVGALLRVLAVVGHHELRVAVRPLERFPRAERPPCGARTRSGGRCRARVAWPSGEVMPRTRCRLHGGASTGPRTREGLARSLANLRGVTVADAPSLRAACGDFTGLGPDGCPACAAKRRHNPLATTRASRERRTVDAREVFCEDCARVMVRAMERGQLRVTMTG
jgi:hypothetical protein